MKNKEWAIIIAVVLVVAVAASLITANITGNDIFRKPKPQQVTYQGVLDMLKAYDQGKCKFMEVPTGDLLDPVDDDYLSFGKPFLDADINKDQVTTGVEWAKALGSECLYGFRMRYLSLQNNDFGGHFVNIGPVGCGGGDLHSDLLKYQADHEVFMFCKP